MKKIFYGILIVICLFFSEEVTYSENWFTVYTTPTPTDYISDIHFYNASLGYAVIMSSPPNDYVLKTTNGGNSWTTYTLTYYGYNARQIYAASPDTIYYGKDSPPYPYFYKSINGGINWTAISSTPYPATDIKFINNNTGFLTCGFNVMKTINGGFNWSQADLFNMTREIFFLNDQTGYIAGYGFYAKTTNQGTYWNSNPLGGVYCESVFFINSATGFITSTVNVSPGINNAKILKTTNGGNSWDSQVFNQWNAGNTYVQFINQDTGYFSIGSRILKTTNCGLNWFESFTFSTFWVEKIQLVNQQIGYGYSGRNIIKTTNAGPSFLKKISDVIPEIYSLYQNYPNPFNPKTSFKLQVSGYSATSGLVRFVIYDILGKEVITLINEKLQPGIYEVEWDGSNYPSGVYFYRLLAGDASSREIGISTSFSDTKKMVLMK